MASRGAMAARSADVQQRMDAAVRSLAEQFDVELPPPFPTVHDAEFRAIDEREWAVLALEHMVAALKEDT